MKKIVTDILNQKYFEETEAPMRIPDCFWEWSLVWLEPSIKKQQWLGLGGAITQASCFNYQKLSKEKQQELLRLYYSNEGLNYQYGRLPIGSQDFGTENYSYSCQEDLKDFSIEKDRQILFPLLKDILAFKKISLLASPWSPPAFMKDSNNLLDGGKLKKEYYALYAEYLVKYLKKYQQEKISIDYITIQNEPFAKQKWESCLWTTEEQQDFIYNYFIPRLEKENLSTKIILWDHNKDRLYKHVRELYPKKNTFIKGVGFHWYAGTFFENLKLVHETYPELLLFETECCTGYSPYNEQEWIKDACLYMNEILGNLNSGMNAFIDWNILLDSRGGPNYAENYCKSPIILNEKADDFICTPIYYYLKHLSLVPIDSHVIFSSVYRNDLMATALEDKEKNIYVIVLNPTNEPKECCLLEGEQLMQDFIAPYALHTYITKQNTLNLTKK